MSDLFQSNGAELSKDRKHRYSLWRVWDENLPRIMFSGVNPSKADEIRNDRTISRCIEFARSWGYGSMYFANLYSFRTPYPKILIENLDTAVGEKCNEWLKKMISESDKVVCAWGSWRFQGFEERAKEVLGFIPEPYCLGINKDGQPKHPLYLKSNLKPVKYLRHE